MQLTAQRFSSAMQGPLAKKRAIRSEGVLSLLQSCTKLLVEAMFRELFEWTVAAVSSPRGHLDRPLFRRLKHGLPPNTEQAHFAHNPAVVAPNSKTT